VEWCEKNFIQYHSMNRARQIRHQLEYLIKRVNMKIQSNPTDSIGIRKAFCAGFFFSYSEFI
jgi:pre-mRNA-splicing factor ATP-dependent RNA helicase DHX16